MNLQSLEEKINLLRQKVEEFEKKNRESFVRDNSDAGGSTLFLRITLQCYNEAYHATGGEYQNALKGLNRLIWEVALLVQGYLFHVFL